MRTSRSFLSTSERFIAEEYFRFCEEGRRYPRTIAALPAKIRGKRWHNGLKRILLVQRVALCRWGGRLIIVTRDLGKKLHQFRAQEINARPRRVRMNGPDGRPCAHHLA